MIHATTYDPARNAFIVTLRIPGAWPTVMPQGSLVANLHDALRSMRGGWRIRDVVVTRDFKTLALVERWV